MCVCVWVCVSVWECVCIYIPLIYIKYSGCFWRGLTRIASLVVVSRLFHPTAPLVRTSNSQDPHRQGNWPVIEPDLLVQSIYWPPVHKSVWMEPSFCDYYRWFIGGWISRFLLLLPARGGSPKKWNWQDYWQWRRVFWCWIPPVPQKVSVQFWTRRTATPKSIGHFTIPFWASSNWTTLQHFLQLMEETVKGYLCDSLSILQLFKAKLTCLISMNEPMSSQYPPVIEIEIV